MATVEAPQAEVRAPEASHTRWLGTLWDFARRDVWTTLLALAAAAILWQLVALIVDQRWLPSWWTVVLKTVELLEDPAFRDALWGSLRDLVIGYLISVLAGVAVGLAMGFSRLTDSAFGVYLDALLFIPPVVTTPIFLSVFGLSRVTLVALIILFAAPIIAVTVRSAVVDVDRTIVEAALSFGASRRQLTLLVVMRAALPGIFTGLHLGMGRAVKGMIIGQLILAVIGLGAYEALFQRSFDAAGLWSIAVVVVGIAIAFSWVVLVLDRVVNSWAFVGQR
jgi:NitT/TauT family transport system permease protein